jgi:hypothetical protein
VVGVKWTGRRGSVAGSKLGSGALRIPSAQPAVTFCENSWRICQGMKLWRPSTISFRNVGLTVLMKWAEKIPVASRSIRLFERVSS